jgi:hypothetical protein
MIWTCDEYLCYTGINGGEWIWVNCQFANGGKSETPLAYLSVQAPNCSVIGNQFQVPGASWGALASYIDADFTNSQNINVVGNVENGGGAGTRGFDTYPLIDVYPRYGSVNSNSDYRTVTSGQQQLNSGGTTAVVTHNCVTTPLPHHISLTPASWMGPTPANSWWVSNVTATTFQINVNVDPGANIQFLWRVDVSIRTE